MWWDLEGQVCQLLAYQLVDCQYRRLKKENDQILYTQIQNNNTTIAIYISHNVPLQSCVLQSSSTLFVPSHLPNLFSVTAFLLVFVLLPPPQSFEQEPISQLLQ